MSESVSTGVWCVPAFGAGFEIALEPSKLQKEGEIPGKGCLFFLQKELWYAPTLVQKRSDIMSWLLAERCSPSLIREVGEGKQKTH